MLKPEHDWRKPMEPFPEDAITEHHEADVVILGAGHSGVACARACAEAGSSVIAVEMMNEKNYWAYGIDFGHINSNFLKSKGVPEVDEIEFFNDWQLRNGNRSNPKLVMQFTKNCGNCFDWFLEALTEDQRSRVDVRYWPAPSKYAGQLNGIKSWIGTATFPEDLWDNRAITDAVKANIERAKQNGAQFFFCTTGKYLEKERGRVTALIAQDRDGRIHRFTARKAVVLAGGDFSRNEDMMRDLCDELVTLAPPDAVRIAGGGRDGSAISMGVWAGGRMAPGPIACMGGNTASPNSPLNVTATLWLDSRNQRYCNEGFADGEFSGIEGARLPPGKLVNLFDGKAMDLLQRQAPVHGSLWVNDPKTPRDERLNTAMDYLENAPKAGREGYSAFDPKAPKGMVPPKLYAADTLENLAEYLGFEGTLKQNLLDSAARYNLLCAMGRDEDFGKDPSLMVPLDTPPYYGMITEHSGRIMGPMVTVDGLWTDEFQNVYNDSLEPIPGLYATGNCCGRRFGVQYSTPVSGVSIGIAWTLGMLLGQHLAEL